MREYFDSLHDSEPARGSTSYAPAACASAAASWSLVQSDRFGCERPTSATSTSPTPPYFFSRYLATTPGQSGDTSVLPEPITVACAAKLTTVATTAPRWLRACSTRSSSSTRPITGSVQSNWLFKMRVGSHEPGVCTAPSVMRARCMPWIARVNALMAWSWMKRR